MNGRGLLWLVGCSIGLVALMVLTAPSRVDTRIRLEREGSAPFDAEVFYASLPEWLGAPVTPVDEPPFLFLADSSRTGTTYMFVSRAFAPDEAEATRLLAYAARGNTVFVSAHVLGGALFDSLGTRDSLRDGIGVRTQWQDDVPWLQSGDLTEDDSLDLWASGVDGTYGFPFTVNRAALNGLDSARTDLLGTLHHTNDYGLDEEPNYVRIRWGRGAVLIHTAPLALTNAALTGEGDGEAYVAGLLASVPQQPVFWDDYTKPYRTQAQTPLRFVLQTPALAWAYWLGLLLLLLLILFRGRRWQRAIPTVRPPPNAQREFARTVGRLHFTHGDTRALYTRKRRIFLDRLRTRLRMPAPDLTDGSARRAARRAGVPEDEATTLFATLRRLDTQSAPAGADLVDLDTRLDRFFRHLDAPARGAGEASGDSASGAMTASGDPASGATTASGDGASAAVSAPPAPR